MFFFGGGVITFPFLRLITRSSELGDIFSILRIINIHTDTFMVSHLISKFDPHKTWRLCAIHAIFFNRYASKLAPIHFRLYNRCFVACRFPYFWKYSSVVTVFKNSVNCLISRTIHFLSLLTLFARDFHQLRLLGKSWHGCTTNTRISKELLQS